MPSSSTPENLSTSARQVLIPLNMSQPRVPDSDTHYVNLQGFSMGTSWQVQCYLPAAEHDPVSQVEELRVGIQAQLDQVVAQMSPWEADSDLTQFNRAPANSWQVLPPEFFKVLQHSVFVAEQTRGAFDPSIGHLANLWGFGPAGKLTQAPDAVEILQARLRTNWQQIRLNPADSSALQIGDVELDLCSTAKGFGVDQVARYLQQIGITSYLVEVGGELRGLGCKPDGQPWWVELEVVPDSTLEQLPIQDFSTSYIVALHGLAVATSGDYNRYFMHEGKRYSHTIDPRTGYPVDHDLASVTVMHSECMIADALATAMSVLGVKKGMAYAKRLHAAARFIERKPDGFVEHLSPAFIAMTDEHLD
ncbi:FAD:protein FMN transferase [Undibacterium sp. Ji22W]|uniref:FAD:protein FMN transferase n=1 Tax=Undibacterium sp. Ji22W TaxID=3413038 RepID=UPI003BF12CCF